MKDLHSLTCIRAQKSLIPYLTRRIFLIAMFGLTPVLPSSQVPESLMSRIAQLEGVPLKLLKSISYVESGHHPWALNVKGKSYVFATRQGAEAFLEQTLQQGQTSIDIGCAQINWHWHGKSFKSAKELLSPAICLRYAARLLKEHRRATGSWMKAALLYHSAHPPHQQIYRQRLVRYLTKGQGR